MRQLKSEGMSEKIPARLTEIIADFQLCEGREKIELLIQYAESLPALPEWLVDHRNQMDQVPECMTPVFIHAEDTDGKMVFYFDVPAESPTVRGFAALIKQGLDQTTPEEILQIPADFYHEMGLHEVLTHQRLNGLSAILAHVKQLCVKAIST
jgi:cysteine desulfuration protein SufE